jgi:hypothetical protein
MVKPSVTPAEIGEAFARMGRLQEELARRERAIGRKAQLLARGLARFMEPGRSRYRTGMGLHAFPVGDEVCLASSYLDQVGDDFRYRYAVLCGGEAARQELRAAVLDPGDSDEPGPGRRVAVASYDDYEAFVERLPIFITDVTRDLEARVQKLEGLEVQAQAAGKQIASLARSHRRQSP